MAMENKCHREIRMKTMLELEGEKFYNSHEKNKGDIHFFVNRNSMRVDIAQPDIVVDRADKFLIIEIELTSSPKRLLGVALAIYSSQFGIFGKGEKPRKIGKKSLIIVLDSKEIDKENSQKRLQIKVVEDIINSLKIFDSFDLVTEEETSKRIKERLGNYKR